MAALVRTVRPFILRTKCAPRYVRNDILLLRKTSSIATDNLKFCQLDKRGLLRVNGTDSVKLLQGLVTNNVELFHQDTTLKTMYCMVLNAQGRVLYDAMLYKEKTSSQTPCFLVECDKRAASSMAKLLKMYKLRSKVDIASVQDMYPWAMFSDEQIDFPIPDIQSKGVISISKDPRTKWLGWRALLSQGASPSELLQGVSESDQSVYDIHRVKLGVSEGMDEIKPGVALPLEYNLDYLNGVSFQKGCYIGQELTARTHHTGVIRKRIMPLTYNSPHSIVKLEQGSPIKTSSGKTSGKLCVIYGQYGLAIMRMAMMVDKERHFIQDNEGHDVEVHPYIPKWWPNEEHSTSS